MNLMHTGLRFGLWDRACFDPGSLLAPIASAAAVAATPATGGLSDIALASLGVGLVGAGVQAYGAIQTGEAQKSAADYQSQVAANNAQIASQNALAATAAGNAQAEQAKIKNDQIVGAMAAGQAASGIDTGSGSALDTRTSQQEIGQLDVLTIRNQAARQAYAYRTQSMSDTAQSQLDTAQGQSALTAGQIGGVTSILGGASSTGNNYANFLKVGAFGPQGLNTNAALGGSSPLG